MCSIEGCDRPAYCRGWCATHYQRWRRHGDPLALANGRGLPLIDRFMARTQRQPNGCLLWTGGTNDRGYARFAVSHAVNVAAHRWSYEYHVGPIPRGHTIDHVRARGCTSQLCVEPTHLETVTLRENLMRGDTPAARNAAKSECPDGHPYDGTGSRGERICRRCRARDQRAYRARRTAMAF